MYEHIFISSCHNRVLGPEGAQRPLFHMRRHKHFKCHMADVGPCYRFCIVAQDLQVICWLTVFKVLSYSIFIFTFLFTVDLTCKILADNSQIELSSLYTKPSWLYSRVANLLLNFCLCN